MKHYLKPRIYSFIDIKYRTTKWILIGRHVLEADTSSVIALRRVCDVEEE